MTSLLLLMSCSTPTPTPADLVPMPSPLTLVEPVPTGDTAAPPRPTLTSPAEATDLDPAAGSVRVELVAAPHVWNGVDGYAYNDQVPGPTLRAVVGDTLTIELDNRLEMPTTIHWHGLEVPYAMDGAGWQVAPVAAGDTFTYTFTVQKAGTFWYHPHFNTERQVDLGLYGVLIVEDPEEPVLEELVVVFDGPSEVVASQIDPTVDPSPTTWLLNGLEDPVWSPPAGETVRVRMVNASNAGYVALDDVRVIARDQGLLEAPESEFVLAPGDRAELEWSVGPEPSTLEPVPWSSAGPAAQPPLRLMDVEPVGDDPRPEHIDWGFVGTLPTEDPGRTDLRYTFTGSAAAGWEINGQTFPAIEPDRFAWGTTVVLEIRNPSPAHHPFHLHGLTFEVLSVDGVVPAVRRVEDTLDVGVRQTVRLLVDANNPGEWMSHCHILPHAENGMMTVFAVE